MLLLILGVLLTIIGAILWYKWENECNACRCCKGYGALGFPIFAIGVGITFACIILACVAHTKTDQKIADQRMEYELLLAQYEVLSKDGAEFLQPFVYEKVYEWNKKVLTAKRESQSLWLNWFYNAKVVEDAKLIGVKEATATPKSVEE